MTTNAVIIILVIAIIIIALGLTTLKSEESTHIEVLPKTRTIEVEVVDEMTKEKVRNLYEEQDIYNAKISYLMRQNKQYEHEISLLDERIERNLDDIRVQMMIQPNTDFRVLKASMEESNQNIFKHKLKLEGMVLTNAERIISYKKKSNAISEQITKIGREIYEQQRFGE